MSSWSERDGPELLRRLSAVDPGPARLILFTFAACLCAYGTHMVYPAFNADDVIQIQPVSQDYRTFLAQGRWGYYLIFKSLLQTSPGGVFVFGLGLMSLTLSAFLASELVGFRSAPAKLGFLLVSVVSLHYAGLFSYDSTRLAYPVANLIAVSGLMLARRRRFVLAVLLLSVVPAIYPVSFELAGTIFLCMLLYRLPDRDAGSLAKEFWPYPAALLMAGIVYMLSLKASVAISGIALDGRSAVDPVAALKAASRIGTLFVGHSLPFINGLEMPYLTGPMKMAGGVIHISFVLVVLHVLRFRRGLGFGRIGLFLVLVLLLIASPYALAFFSPLDQFSPWALFPFATVYALFVAMPMDLLLVERENGKSALAAAIGALGLLFVILSGIASSSRAFDEYLGSQQDLMATNRIIARIETVIAETGSGFGDTIPIVVKADTLNVTGPRGAVYTARSKAWSREWIFRLVDRRFAPVTGDARTAVLEGAEAHGAWPASDSVYLRDGVVVVILE